MPIVDCLSDGDPRRVLHDVPLAIARLLEPLVDLEGARRHHLQRDAGRAVVEVALPPGHPLRLREVRPVVRHAARTPKLERVAVQANLPIQYP
eukprot:1190679-Prorocentrum_minimum.AAC.1